MKNKLQDYPIHPEGSEIRRALRTLDAIHQEEETRRRERLVELIPELESIELETVEDKDLLFVCCLV